MTISFIIKTIFNYLVTVHFINKMNKNNYLLFFLLNLKKVLNDSRSIKKKLLLQNLRFFLGVSRLFWIKLFRLYLFNLLNIVITNITIIIIHIIFLHSIFFFFFK